MKTYGIDEHLDLVVVGSGPAGLGALHAANRAGLNAVAIDKGPVCSALMAHPTYMRWFSTFDKLELGGFPMVVTEKNPTRREYLKYCQAFVRYFGLRIVTYCAVTAVKRSDAGFRVTGRDRFQRSYTWNAHHAIVATGFFDTPRLLGVPGEDLPHVSHYYREAHGYADHEVLVIGAGNSAAETAIELYREGARVTVAMREQSFQTKYWIEPDIENRIKEGSIICHRGVEVAEIRPDEVELRAHTGERISVPVECVLAMTGFEPDTTLIEAAGADVDKQTGKPRLTEALETTTPGLYVAGTLCAGKEANAVFVENGREHGGIIIGDILRKRKDGAHA
ncbi:MAG: NAD(P)-binding domain-containing protein [Candidatus Hydrogenedentota bacterium]